MPLFTCFPLTAQDISFPQILLPYFIMTFLFSQYTLLEDSVIVYYLCRAKNRDWRWHWHCSNR